MIILNIAFCLLTNITGLNILYRQTTITLSLSNIMIYKIRHPFPVALGVISTWKL
jgi:uncharacterized membrane protein (UPF0136 family)